LYRLPPFVSASAVVTRGEQLLVVVDPIRAEPILPGGHLKWRETPEDALVREVWEETGYLIRPTELVMVRGGQEWAGEPGVVRIVYDADVIGGALTSSAEGEATWQNLAEVARSSTRDAPILRVWLELRGSQADST
jgi:ADP-ribose pyrophosphatase YjhB (NUDIX family)